jgi:hypothetical protein
LRKGNFNWENTSLKVIKILKKSEHPFIKCKINANNILERSLEMANLFSKLKLSPKILFSGIYKDYLIIISDYIDNKFNSGIIKT